MVKTRTKGTMVVNHESEEICGISWGWQWGGYRERDGPNLYGTGRTPTSPAPRTHLQDEEEKEIGVGHFLELLKEVDGQEGDDVVLGGLDAVAHILELLIVLPCVGAYLALLWVLLMNNIHHCYFLVSAVLFLLYDVILKLIILFEY